MKFCEKCEQEISTRDGQNMCDECEKEEASKVRRRESARRRREANRAVMESLGMHRVKGALGGIYYE